jgi:hypothetical protein
MKKKTKLTLTRSTLKLLNIRTGVQTGMLSSRTVPPSWVSCPCSAPCR